MNREIIFRGKRLDNGKWSYGDLRYHKEDVCIFEQGGNKGEQVKRDTIGQFTGLTDKNGNLIFEGDIVRIYDSDYEEHSDQQVKFAHGVFGVDNWTKKTLTTLSFFMGCDSEYSVEVVGNRYDNPELLVAK